ncbi:hypothetical protein TSUD_50250 [Trifolium subterraneum]|uniref:3'-5' exonuclease domain-containing protein n=1 Tax=Trifolium subterraneum TaxID=3900 RepID=A0A2Z6LLI9_TRISU|nr:hypothetical protein TSUD_50250 [Trifolium subterraneum]
MAATVLHSNVTVNFNGRPITVTVTASGSVVDEWINTTISLGEMHLSRGCLLIGMSMDRGGNTLHLCVNSRCLIFQISRADSILISFRLFLLNRDCKFAGFLNQWHRTTLADSKHHLLMYKGSFDLRFLNRSCFDNSMQDIIHKCVGWKVELKDEIRSSNWYEPTLSDDQVVFACIESYCAFIVARDCNLRRYLF